MDRETDKILDKFTSEVLKDFSSEKPSFDFTDKVMSRVEDMAKSKMPVYTPLISKKIWFSFGVLFMSAFIYLIFGNVHVENSAVLSLLEETLPKLDSIVLPHLKMSNVFLNGIIGFLFFMVIQIFVLKSHFEKRFA